MQKIRRATKKNRGLLTVIIGVLILGLLSSVAMWGAGFTQPNQPTVAEMIDEMIAQQEALIAGLDLENVDFISAQTYGGHFMHLSELYQFKYEQTQMLEPEWQERALAASRQAEDLFDQAYTLLRGIVAELDLASADFTTLQSYGSHFMNINMFFQGRYEQTQMAESELRARAVAAAQQAEELYAQAYLVLPADMDDDDRVNFLFNYASIREVQGNFNGALEILLQAEQVQPENAFVQAMMATMHAEMGDVINALGRFVNARDLEPAEILFADMYATYLFSFVEPSLAIEEWDKFIDYIGEDHPSYAEAVSRRDHFISLAAMFASPAPIPEFDDENGAEDQTDEYTDTDNDASAEESTENYDDESSYEEDTDE